MTEKQKHYADVDTLDKAKLVARWLDEKKARGITVIDVSGLSSVAEAVIVVSAQSVRHGQALADTILDNLAQERLELLGMEGYRSGQWILLDVNDVVVHIFQEDTKRLFNLEGLWSRGREVSWGAREEADVRQ